MSFYKQPYYLMSSRKVCVKYPVQHSQQVSSRDELHDQWIGSVLHDQAQKLDDPLMVQFVQDTTLFHQRLFVLTYDTNKEKNHRKTVQYVAVIYIMSIQATLLILQQLNHKSSHWKCEQVILVYITKKKTHDRKH